MIVKVHKYLIYGLKEKMDRFFELSQRAGFLEFIGLSHKKALELTDEIKTILAAIKIAKKHEIHPLQAPPLPKSPVELAKKLIELNTAHEQLLEERRLLVAEIARIAPFGHFSMDDLHAIEKEGKRLFQFFCMKSDVAREMSLPPEVLYIGTEYDLDYFLAINKEPTKYPKMIEILIEKSVGDLTKRLYEVDEKTAALESDIRAFSNGLPFLQSGLVDLLNEFHLSLTKHDAETLFGNAMFAIEAWVPETKVKALLGLLSGLDVCCEEISIESHDQIPTCMENKGIGKIGEDIVNVYDTPSHTDRDPSKWVLIFFALFFAMIVADAGYGLIYLLIALFFKYKFPNMNATGRRFIKLVFILASATIVWGAATGAFLGIEIGPNNPYRKFSFLHTMASRKAEYHLEQKDDVYEEYVREFPAVASATDGHDFLVKAASVKDGKTKYVALDIFYDNILMEISLLVGIIHISLSFLRYILRNWAGFGWILFLWGGYLYFPKMLNATTIANFMHIIDKQTAYAWGEYLLYAGIGLALLASAIQKRWGVVHEVMNIVQIFGDVLSYIRLYALALAGMMVASTFNDLGVRVGLIGGIGVILFGHLTNISLSIMGGVIHGLRLNFLEWYHYCFEGSGRLFNPLRLKKTK
jgi:V/A-type H+-transporting ATPase subunit I